jgi:hypothetical protein
MYQQHHLVGTNLHLDGQYAIEMRSSSLTPLQRGRIKENSLQKQVASIGLYFMQGFA